MTQAAPTSDCEIGGPRMTAKYNNNDIQTIRPKSATDQVNTAAAALGPGYAQAAAAADVLGAMPGGSQQEKLQEIEDLMRLKDTNPDEFAAYIQMAADAAKLAEERPDVFNQLMQDSGAAPEEEDLTAAQMERNRAMGAASELTGTKNGKSGSEEGINLPGGRTLGAGGAKETPASIVISPAPGFVIKTKLVDTGMKVFVNVCQHEHIGESSMVKKLDKDGQEVEGLNIPMSVGPPFVDKDNAGEECIVYDVIINPKSVEECRTDKTGGQRDWLCHLAMQSVMSKHDCRLDPKYKLPKLTFKGNKEKGPAKQRVRDDSAKPKISELKANGGSSANGGVRSAAKGPLGETASTVPLTSLTSTITAVWACRGGGGRGGLEETLRESDVSVTSLEETVRIPLEKWPDSLVVTAAGLRKEALAVDRELGTNVRQVGVRASAYECTIKASGHHPLQVRLPYAVLPDTASAQANSHDGTLFVNLSVDKSPPSQKADAGSKPWLLSSALEGGGERPVGQAGRSGGVRGKVGEAGATGVQGSDDVLPEDRFHLKLPAGVNQYTGAAEGDDASNDHDLLGQGQDHNGIEDQDQDCPIAEEDSLPEERFHRADIVSQHMIDTREKQRQEKITRAEEEREARRKEPQDDGVEYVDFDDYRAGGKLGPPAPPSPNASARIQGADANNIPEKHDPKFSQDMAAATRVLSDAMKENEGGGGGGGGDGAAIESRLSSTFWADLLD